MAAARSKALQYSNRDQANGMKKLVVDSRVVNCEHVCVQGLLQRVSAERTGGYRDKSAQCAQPDE